MKTVHLIRHAKSSWDYSSLADAERPLNNRGKEACKIMAPKILEAGCTFETVHCSIATRAQMTIQGISNALAEKEISWTSQDRLYTFNGQDLLDYCRSLEDSLTSIVLVGHNPAMTAFTNGMGDQSIDNLPTCGYVQIELPTQSWSAIEPGTGHTQTILTPKMFR